MRKFSQDVELGPNEQKDVTFDPAQVSQLNFDNPRLWWPAQVGKPELQTANELRTDDKSSETTETNFGIREITSELNAHGKVGSRSMARSFSFVGSIVARHDAA